MYLKALFYHLLVFTILLQAQQDNDPRYKGSYIKSFRYNNGKSKNGFQYDSLHHLLQEWHFKKHSHTGLYKVYHIDSSLSIGKKRWRTYKWGKWKTYDKNGKLIKIQKFKYDKLYGTQKDLITGERQYLRFGVPKSNLRNAKGQKYVFLFSNHRPYSHGGPEEELYACRKLPAVGCVGDMGIRRRMAWHNTLVYLRQSLRFGFSWQTRYEN